MRKEGIPRSCKRKLATISGSEIRGPGISVHSQEPGGCKAVGGDVRSVSVPHHWAQEGPVSQFLVCFGPWLPFYQRFYKSLQLSL